MKIAFFGAGLMGTGFVRRMLANGDEVNVWNRSPARAKALEEHGARAFADAAAAVAHPQPGSEVIPPGPAIPPHPSDSDQHTRFSTDPCARQRGLTTQPD